MLSEDKEMSSEITGKKKIHERIRAHIQNNWKDRDGLAKVEAFLRLTQLGLITN